MAPRVTYVPLAWLDFDVGQRARTPMLALVPGQSWSSLVE